MSDNVVPVRAAEVRAGRWELAGAGDLSLINSFLGYVADWGYSPRTVRAYAFELLHFARWLAADGTGLGQVDTDVLLRYLAANRTQQRDGKPENVIPLARGSAAGFAPATINRRMAAISGLFGFRSMRDPDAVNPVPMGAAARRAARGERTGLLGLQVADVDIGRGWVRVTGKGDKERRVPVDPDVAGLIQSYLLAERPETASKALFVVAKGAHRGQPLTAAGLRRVYRYHREISGVAAGHPHALRHTFGTALAESGVDLAVLQALMGHDHVDSSAAYIHLAPEHVRAAYDAARQRQRAAGGRR